MDEKDARAIVGAADRIAQSAAAHCEARFTLEGARAPRGTCNPYKPGSAAATWWQRGHDAAADIPVGMVAVSERQFFGALHADSRDVMPSHSAREFTTWRVQRTGEAWGWSSPGWANPGAVRLHALPKAPGSAK